MAKVGRPPNFNKQEIERLIELFDEYIEQTEVPVVAEFAYLNNVTRQSLYDYEQFSTLLKRCIDKKEAQLEKLGLTGKVNPTMAIFSLKQLGWRDKQEIEQSGETRIKVTISDD